MKTKQVINYMLALALIVLAGGCGTDASHDQLQQRNSVSASDTQEAAKQLISGNSQTLQKTADAGSSRTIPQNTRYNRELSTFYKAVQKAGMVQVLSNTGPYTVFAPTNAAFDSLPANTMQELLKPANKAELTALVNSHIVAGKVDASALQEGSTIKTLGNQQLQVTKEQNKVMINGAEVTDADMMSKNGVIHVVNKVLLPEAKEVIAQ
ncbi:fasciclin domain-containing protein [Pontibacter burrus]|uniref:Fasciclin domain-containing protein n=1 Tax=Pontibacter burrus TaxID=2704466 RepID=A0A6B3LXZ8_9BACT|nr:fasciclin domain-containing protein [Pontibacter burrus]NEM98314.1 fasciclin domain-containing protein [Pontibacter burrus]